MIVIKCFIILLFFTCSNSQLFSQEIKYYINGGNIENTTHDQIKEGDLLRVVFLNKQTGYKFQIPFIKVVLIVKDKNRPHKLLSDTTEFTIVNPSQTYSANPTFTFELLKELELLKNNEYNISFKVTRVLSDTYKGRKWIMTNMHYKEVALMNKH
jgi:hypothetical protein